MQVFFEFVQNDYFMDQKYRLKYILELLVILIQDMSMFIPC